MGDIQVAKLVVGEPIRVVDGIGRQFIGPAGQNQGLTRDQLTVPICRAQGLGDEVFYDSPAGGATYFLPRWRVTGPGASPQIVMRQGPTGWSLVVHLSGYAAPSIASDLGAALPVPCAYSCIIGYNLAAEAGSTGNVLREVTATEVTGDGSTLVATFSGTDSAALNQLYSAMSDETHGTVLTVRRTVTAAVEIPKETNGGGGWTIGPIKVPIVIRNPPIIIKQPPVVVNPPDPPIIATVVDASVLELGTGVTPRRLSSGQAIPVAADLPSTQTARADPPQLDASGKFLHRFGDDALVVTGVQRNRLTTDVVTGPWRVFNGVKGSTTHYQVITAELNDVQPFFFPPDLYPAIYAGVQAGSASFAMHRVEVAFEGKPYPYYQDAGSAADFYFLPDSFQLGRALSTPHTLMLQIDADTGSTMDDVKVRFNFMAVPVTSAERLSRATEALRQFAPGPYPPGVTGPQLMPLVVAKEALTLSLLLGGVEGAGGSGALLSLRNGIVDSETLSVPQFSTVYNALFGGIALVSGSLDVRLDGASGPSESIPVELRVANAWGPVLDIVGRNSGVQAVQVTLTNTIESPVTVTSLSARVARDATPEPPAGVNGKIDFGGATLPVELAPGEQLAVTVTASSPIGGTGELRAVVTPAITVHADPRAVWGSILGHMAPMPLKRSITARLPADIFAERLGPNGHPALKGVTVEFEAGVAAAFDTADVLPGAPSPFVAKPVNVPVGLEGYVIAGVVPGTYVYRVTAITAMDDLVHDPVPRTSNLDTLDVTLPPFPPPQ